MPSIGPMRACRGLQGRGHACAGLRGNRLLFKHEGQVLDPLFAPYELTALEPDLDNAVLLGRRPSGEPRIAFP